MEVVIRLSFNKIYNNITLYIIIGYNCVIITIISNIRFEKYTNPIDVQ